MFADPAPGGEHRTQSMKATLVHQGSRHHRIIAEVTGEEPIIGLDLQFSHRSSQSPQPPGGFNPRDLVEQSHATSRQTHRRCQLEGSEAIIEGCDQISTT